MSLPPEYDRGFFGPTVQVLYEDFHGEVTIELMPAAIAVWMLEYGHESELGKTIRSARILWGDILDHWSFSF